VHAMQKHGGVEVKLHLILNLGTAQRWACSFTPWPLTWPQGKFFHSPLMKLLGWPQSWS